MLVYGDHADRVRPAELLEKLAAGEGRYLSHEELRERFIALAGLTQGIADADFRDCGCDRHRPAEQALLEALTKLGRVLMESWDADCSGGVAPAVPAAVDLPGEVSVRLPEGYAFYALYPEAYGLAARRLALSGPPRVIGLRSIGSGLAAMAAAALGGPVPVTLRPCGDPFARRLRLDEALERALLEGDPHYVIVDEGPGLSGSSFGCVADWLEDDGVAAERIAFLPGHAGELGPEASARHAERWRTVQRPVAGIDRLRAWVEAVVGPITCWKDVSGGEWRRLRQADEAAWPPVTPAWERAKYLVRTAVDQWLVRFAGLGAIGEEKTELAERLAAAGFGPDVAGLTHGWLILRWHDEADPARPSLEELSAYLQLRADLPGPPVARLTELVTMVRRNVPELGSWDPDVGTLGARVRPVRIDGRMAAHEWLRLPCGRLFKADALDHHRSHDLVGCQDIAWDVAAAGIELDLPAGQGEELAQGVGADRDLTRFYAVAYAAFRLGAHRMSEGMVDAAEAERHRRAARRFELALVDAVEQARDIDQARILGVEALA